jgi:hypothetical protein
MQLTDSCLDFLLDYLPSMPIPPITGLKDNVEYTISQLDMSGFKLNKVHAKPLTLYTLCNQV